MDGWLSEIEERDARAREQLPKLPSDEFYFITERMARVLRELVSIIKSQSVILRRLGWSPLKSKDFLENTNLSDDAKDLLKLSVASSEES